MKTLARVIGLAAFVMAGNAAAAVWYVDVDNTSGVEDGLAWATAFTTVGEGVTAAYMAGGGEVWVAEGTYFGTTSMRSQVDIYGGFAGTETTREERDWFVHTTTIDRQWFGRCVVGEDFASLDGFTVTNGWLSDSGAGAGLFCSEKSPTIRNCTFCGNRVYGRYGTPNLYPIAGDGWPAVGGELYLVSSNSVIDKCIFINNGAKGGVGGKNYSGWAPGNGGDGKGGALYISGGAPNITNCVFLQNWAEGGDGGQAGDYQGHGGYGRGGTVYVAGGLPQFANCTFFHNSASAGQGYVDGGALGGAFYILQTTKITNSILWDNSPSEIEHPSYAVVRYSDVMGGVLGAGNIFADPQFVNASAQDLRLGAGSPCIDAGTYAGAPPDDLQGLARPQGWNYDMGAYEYAGSFCRLLPVADAAASGKAGGPFTPASVTYRLANTGAAALPWTAASAQPWMDVTPADGTLAPGAEVDIAVVFNAAANALMPSTYANAVTFSANGRHSERVIVLTVEEPLTITPSTGLTASGWAGGPFTPGAVAYTLTDTGSPDLPWSAMSAEPWMNITPTSGTLSADASVIVTATFGAVATALSPGDFANTLVFNDDSTGYREERSVDLTVLEPLTIAPDSAFKCSGPQGGPFPPRSAEYTLANTSPFTVSWLAGTTQPWLDITPSSGTLSPGGGVTVTVAVNAAANDLSVGTFTDMLSFNDDTTGYHAERDVTLEVLAQAVTITLSDSIPPSDDKNLPFGLVIKGYGPVTQHITVSNSDPQYDLVVSAVGLETSTIEDFESGSLAAYTSVSGTGAFSVVSGAAHDGTLGLDATSTAWIYRNDASAHVSQGDTISYWVRPVDSGGYHYCSFGATSSGTYALVLCTSTGIFAIEANPSYSSHTSLAAVAQSWTLNKWYRLEVQWGKNGVITGRAYDSDGVTLLNSVSATDTTYTEGGVAFRSTVPSQFDTVVKGVFGMEGRFELANVPSMPAVLRPSESFTADVLVHDTATGRFANHVIVDSTGANDPHAAVSLSALIAPDALRIEPAYGFVTAGPRGGPFDPSEATYTLTNDGDDVLHWTAWTAEHWLDLSDTSGTLVSGEEASVTVALSAEANLLPYGTFTAAVHFTNADSGYEETRIFTIAVKTVRVDASNLSGQEDGLSWATAFRTIRQGIDAVPAEGGEVWVRGGVYPEAITLKSGCKLYGGFAGTETARDQRDFAANVTTIDATTASPRYHVVTMDTLTNSRLDGFTVTGGLANGPTTFDTVGAGIYTWYLDATNTIANCIVVGNSASYAPGGMYFRFETSCLVTDCIIAGNTAGDASHSGYGGGVYCYRAAPTFQRCVISANKATRYAGGICVDQCAPRFSNCVVSGNVSDQYGGGFVVSGTGATPTIVTCTIAYNSSNSTGGGGAYVSSGGYPIFTNCALCANNGYCLREASTSADPVVTNCLFQDNTPVEYYNTDVAALTGAAAINALAGTSGNVDGLPQFA